MATCGTGTAMTAPLPVLARSASRAALFFLFAAVGSRAGDMLDAGAGSGSDPFGGASAPTPKPTVAPLLPAPPAKSGSEAPKVSATTEKVALCMGEESFWEKCDTGLTCADCASTPPQDCEFDTWSEWHNFDQNNNCTGLLARERKLKSNANECGSPCDEEPIAETKKADEAFLTANDCIDGDVDCELSEWSDWGPCCDICPVELKQSSRTRTVITPKKSNGRPCHGHLTETKKCRDPDTERQDCKVSEWGEWTTCSRSCGVGWKTKQRRIIVRPGFGGNPCQQMKLRTQEECNQFPCPDLACKVSPWSAWDDAGCTGSRAAQRYKTRTILTPAIGMGECYENLKKTMACPESSEPPPSCFLDWQSWSECTAPCGGGQTQRFREPRILNGTGQMPGHCSEKVNKTWAVREVLACGPQICEQDGCSLDDWAPWSECSSECGTGAKTRERAPKKASMCQLAALREVDACFLKPCITVDCTWGEWNDWNACSVSCGRGSHRRTREIHPAQNGGAECIAEVKEEMLPCSAHNCTCVPQDGKWSDWAPWSNCSSACKPAYRSRHREVAIKNNQCGTPAEGSEDEVELCSDVEDCSVSKDCEWNQWEPWTDCSKSCYGVSQRERTIKQYAAGAGKQCANGDSPNEKEIRDCNPDPFHAPANACKPRGPNGCELGEWTEWSQCSATCAGGERKRTREVTQEASSGGSMDGCAGAREEQLVCNPQSCDSTPQVDCRVEDWQIWSACRLQQGGGGMQRRVRSYRANNKLGIQCSEALLEEGRSCGDQFDNKTQYCVWSQWKLLGQECSVTCGDGFHQSSRQLVLKDQFFEGDEIFFKGPVGIQCSSATFMTRFEKCRTADCPNECKPVDCKFQSWQDWQAPVTTQLCTRTRGVSVQPECGGELCKGNLTETKACACEGSECPTTDRIDCKLGDWSVWAGCRSDEPMLQAGQQSRHRGILDKPLNNGVACQAPLKETKSCPLKTIPADQDCVMGGWSVWSPCDATCGGGLQSSERSISRYPKGAGTPCETELKMVRACNAATCNVEDCEVNEWTAWSSCSSENVEHRVRMFKKHSGHGGKTCGDPADDSTRQPLMEVRPCNIIQDCDMSAWTEWDQCDKPCDGGQKQRSRQVQSLPHLGEVCEPILVEMQGCNKRPCDSPFNCKVGDWEDWGACSADDCINGYRKRDRKITQPMALNYSYAIGCNLDLTESGPCLLEDQMCQLANKCACNWEWSAWSECSKSCGGGSHTRNHTLQARPTGCEPCEPEVLAELSTCKTEKCTNVCTQAEWAEWGIWSECSATCKNNGGSRWRSREPADGSEFCQRPPVGAWQIVEQCNDDVPCEVTQDCEFADWNAWSACSSSCSGLKERRRLIRRAAQNEGIQCSGALLETTHCEFRLDQPILDFSDLMAPGAAAAVTGMSSLPAKDLKASPVFQATSFNNLAGKGPDDKGPKEIRIQNVAVRNEGKDDALGIDLVITAVGDAYEPSNISLNELQGNFGSVNVAANKPAMVKFELMILNTSTKISVKDWVLKFYSLDDCAQPWSITTKQPVTRPQCQDYYVSKDQQSFLEAEGSCAHGASLTLQMPAYAPELCETTPTTLDLSQATKRGLSQSPAAPMVFSKVMQVGDKMVDLHIDIPSVTGANYKAANESDNGGSHSFGVISVKTGTKATLRYKFYYEGTNDPVFVPGLKLSFFDVDQPTYFIRESISVWGAARAHRSSDESKLLVGKAKDFQHPDTGVTVTNGLLVESVQNEVVDPNAPAPLTDPQQNAVVDFLWAQPTAEFFVTLEVKNEDQSGDHKHVPAGRAFLFTMTSCGEVHAARPGTGCRMSRPQIGDAVPGKINAMDEQRALMLRFMAVQSVQLELKSTGEDCCGHNFLFASKICADDSCDSCPQDTVCKLSDWSEWTECPVTCGGDNQNRTRLKLLQPRISPEDKDSCTGALEDARSCNTQSCTIPDNCTAVDCEYSVWGMWSACDACGGTRSRTRTENITAACNGRACIPGGAMDYEKCPTANCVAKDYCAWGEWTTGPCLRGDGTAATCGKGTQQRARHLVAVERPPVINDPNMVLVKSAQESSEDMHNLFNEMKILETRRTQLLVVSFSAGAVLFMVFGAAVSRMRSRPAAARTYHVVEVPDAGASIME